MSMTMSLSIYIVHYRTVPLVHSMRCILLKQVRLRQKLAMLSSGSSRLLLSAFQTVGQTSHILFVLKVLLKLSNIVFCGAGAGANIGSHSCECLVQHYSRMTVMAVIW